MSRLNTQVGLSRSPGVPTGVGRVSPGSFTPVADNTAGNLLGLVQQAVGTIGAIQEQDKRKSDEELQSAYEASSANLIRLREEAKRDPSKETAFIRAYEASSSKFSGTRYASEITQLGETTYTGFAERADKRADAAAIAFVSDDVMVAVNGVLAEKDTQESLLAIGDYADRLDKVEEVIASVMPDKASEVLTDAGRDAIRQQAIKINNNFQKAFEQQEQAKQQAAEQKTAESVARGLANGDLTFDRASEMIDPTVFDTDDIIAVAADGMQANIYAAGVQGDDESILRSTTAAYNLLDKTNDPQTRRALTEAIASGQDALGGVLETKYAAIWAQHGETSGPEAANKALELELRRDLSKTSLGEAAMERPYNTLVAEGFDRFYVDAAKQAAQKFFVKPEEPPALNRTQQSAVEAFNNPSFVADPTAYGDIVTMPSSDWAVMGNEVTKAVVSAGEAFNTEFPRLIGGQEINSSLEYTKLIASATYNPPLRAAILADRILGSQGEISFVRQFMSDNYLGTQEGFDIAISALQEIGGNDWLDMVPSVTDDVAKSYALTQTMRSGGEATFEQYQAHLQDFNQFGVKVVTGVNTNYVSIAQGIATKEFAEEFGVRRVDPVTAQRIASLVPLSSADESSYKPAALAKHYTKALNSMGLYVIEEPTSLKGDRSRVTLVTSPTIPEVLGKNFTSKKVGDALSFPGGNTQLQVRLANIVSGGETSDIFEVAAATIRERQVSIGDTSKYRDLESDALRQMSDDGNLRIAPIPSQANKQGTPIALILRNPDTGYETSIKMMSVDFSTLDIGGQGPHILNPGYGAFTPAQVQEQARKSAAAEKPWWENLRDSINRELRGVKQGARNLSSDINKIVEPVKQDVREGNRLRNSQ